VGHGHNMNETNREVTKEIMRAVDLALISDMTMEIRWSVRLFNRPVRDLESVLVSEKVIS
jgi:hypothetical protein